MAANEMQSKSRGLLSASVSIAIALAAGGLGSVATLSSVQTWYETLNKPSFNPPNSVFAPVWTTLYVLMALAAWRIWRSGVQAETKRLALLAYGAQLVLNVLWSVTFFGLRQPGLALADIGGLIAVLVVTMAAFWRIDRAAGWMLAPYLGWVSFASLLNFEIWRLN